MAETYKIEIAYTDGAEYRLTRATAQSAAYDLHAHIKEPLLISKGQTFMIYTGIRLAMPPSLAALILPRSGLAIKEGLRPANTPGLIDADYRGELIIGLHRDYSDGYAPLNITVEPGDRIAQLLFIPRPIVMFEEVDELPPTARGEGGFGHTGLKGLGR